LPAEWTAKDAEEDKDKTEAVTEVAEDADGNDKKGKNEAQEKADTNEAETGKDGKDKKDAQKSTDGKDDEDKKAGAKSSVSDTAEDKEKLAKFADMRLQGFSKSLTSVPIESLENFRGLPAIQHLITTAKQQRTQAELDALGSNIDDQTTLANQLCACLRKSTKEWHRLGVCVSARLREQLHERGTGPSRLAVGIGREGWHF
jgi:hypothetical protein